MPSKKHKPEEIIGKLREVGLCWRRGGTTAEACLGRAVAALYQQRQTAVLTAINS